MAAFASIAIDLGSTTAPSIQAGQGTPLLLLHGGGSRAAHFRPLMEALAPQSRVIAYDQRGFGDHLVPDGVPIDHRSWAEDVIGVLDRLQIDRAFVLGWSLGCPVAINAARAHPGRISGLVLLGAPDPGRAVDTDMLRRRFAARTGLAPEALAARIADDLRPRLAPTHRENDALLSALVADVMAAPHAMQARVVAASTTRPDLLAAARALRCPAALITGEHDTICPPEGAKRLAAALDAPPVTIMRECGHYLAVEAPERLAVAVAEQLRRLQADTGVRT